MSICNPKHSCAADGCGIHIPVARFMCGTHWAAVPASTKTNLNLAFTRWLKERTLDSVKELREAQKAAVESLRGAT